MIRAAQIGLGWWGKTLVESVQGTSDQIQFVAATSRTKSDDYVQFTQQQGLRFADSYEQILADPTVDAVVLATPHSQHAAQVIAAAQAGKHVFCEKPFALHTTEAEAAVAAVKAAGVTLGLGYNRRFHPEMTKLREQIRSGALGTILHIEATMTFPNALALKADAWRARRDETPAGGADTDGGARDRRDDRSVRADRHGLLSELPAGRRRRCRRYDQHTVPDEGRDVGLPRDDDGDRPRLQLSGVWQQRLGAVGRDDARRGRAI